MNENITIRPYQAEDYEAVLHIWQACDLSLGHSDTFEEVERVRRLQHDLFLVLEQDGQIIATVMGAFDGRRGYIHHLAVLPKYQSHGCGKQLMSEAEKRFAAMGAVKLHLFVETRNQQVEDYYHRLGWHTRDDLIMMSKNLK